MNNDYDSVMKLLIKTVVRMFYEPSQIVITDILLKNILLSDTELCSRMKLLNREFNKFIVRLKEDNLIKHNIKVEVQEDNRQMLRTLYFFNFAEVRDVIKYKIFKMAKTIEDKINISGEKYSCPVCKRVFSALEAQACMDEFIFKCIICKIELEEYVAKMDENGIDLKNLMSSLEPVIKLLKEADKYKIPSLDYFQVLEIKNAKEKKAMAINYEENKIENEENGKNIGLEISDEKYVEEDDGFDDDNELTKRIKKGDDSVDNKGCMISVNGILKNIFDITEEDKDNMTEDEYTNYFELYSKYC